VEDRAVTRAAQFLALLALAAGCRAAADPPAEPAAAGAPPEAVAETLTTALPLRVPATVYVENDAAVPARAAGIVQWIGADLGTRVGAGQLLARLESVDQELALGRAKEVHEAALRLAGRTRQLVTAGGVTTAEAEDTETALRQSELALRQAERELERTRVTAPFAGTVSARWARSGRLVAEGDSLFRVTALAPLLATVQVPEGAAARLRPGSAVRTETAAGPTAGRVLRLAPVVDAASGTREVVVQLEPRRGLVPGATATVVVEGLPRTVVALPRAVIGPGGLALVVTASGPVARSVTLGADLPGDRVEIIEGVAAGERVVAPAP
jgi:RND family efflux transporter MFP subunit